MQRLSFSPDGVWLLATGTMLQSQPAVAIWDVATGCTVAVGHADDVIADVAWHTGAQRSLPDFPTVSHVRDSDIHVSSMLISALGICDRTSPDIRLAGQFPATDSSQEH